MQKQAIKIWFQIVLFFSLMPMIIFAQQTNDIQYKFHQTDSTYSFFGTFKINAEPDCLLKICYKYKHMRALAPDAKEVLLIASENNHNKISYTYRKLYFFENTSVWSRELNKEKLSVNFKLISSKNNLKILPRMISSRGFYQIKEKEDYALVEYYQQIRLSKSSITEFYIDLIKKGAIQFMHRFSEYAVANCD